MLETLAERLRLGLPLFAAAGIVALVLAGLGWQVWRWQADAAVPVRNTGSAAPAVQDPLPVILSGKLFGAAAVEIGGGRPTVTLTATGYTLRAAFAGTSGAGAIIEASGGEGVWYALGARLSDGAILREVHSDHVLLERDGNRERLDFPKLEDLPATVASAPVSEGSPGIESGTAEPIPADAPAEEKARIIRQRLEELRNRSRT